MAEDGLGFRFVDHDEIIFNGDDAAIRDAGMHLLKEVGYDESTQHFSKGAPLVEVGDAKAMIGVGEMDDIGHMSLSEGSDFFLF